MEKSDAAHPGEKGRLVWKVAAHNTGLRGHPKPKPANDGHLKTGQRE
jgi:hypothetical protein